MLENRLANLEGQRNVPAQQKVPAQNQASFEDGYWNHSTGDGGYWNRNSGDNGDARYGDPEGTLHHGPGSPNAELSDFSHTHIANPQFHGRDPSPPQQNGGGVDPQFQGNNGVNVNKSENGTS